MADQIDRISHLEREVRDWKTAAIVAIAIIVLLLVVGGIRRHRMAQALSPVDTYQVVQSSGGEATLVDTRNGYTWVKSPGGSAWTPIARAEAGK